MCSIIFRQIYYLFIYLFITSRRQTNFCTCLSFCSQGGGVPGQVPPRQVHPPGQVPPPQQVHPLPPGRNTPQVGTQPPGKYTPRAGTLCQVHPPAMYAGIRSTSGRYASYWNAFLFIYAFKIIFSLTIIVEGKMYFLIFSKSYEFSELYSRYTLLCYCEIILQSPRCC